MTMKIICKISEKISIWADEHQYVVRTQTSSKQKMKHADSSYFSSLEYCFEEVFEYLCRAHLADGRSKEIKEVAEIIIATKKEIIKIMRPFSELGTSTNGAAEVGRGRERDF